MSLSRVFTLILFVSLTYSSYAQDGYSPVQAKGPIPVELQRTTNQKIALELENMPSGLSSEERKQREEFAIMSNYHIDELLLGGRVLFNDEISNYVNDVGQLVLANEEQSFRDSIKFFVLKSNLTNAFATNQGIVFVTLGLLSQLTCEAELAFILGHEVGHIKKRHVIGNYLKGQKLMRNNSQSRYYTHDEKIRLLSSYSKESEFEADEMGFKYLSETEYFKHSMIDVFDVLMYSYLPFDEVAFDCSFLMSPLLEIPEDIVKDTTMPITAEEDYEDDLSTHPNIRKRKEQVLSLVSESDLKMNSGSRFIIGEDRFKKVQELARKESIRNNLRDRQYVRALYNLQVIESKYGSSDFVERSRAKALYGISKYKSYRKYRRIASKWNKYEGNLSRAYRIFDELENEDANILALAYNYRLLKESNLQDKHLKLLARDLMWDMNEKFDMDYQTLVGRVELSLQEPEEEEQDTTQAVEEDVDDENLSKYEKIRRQRANQTDKDSGPDGKYLYYRSLAEFYKDSAFKANYEDITERFARRDEVQNEKTQHYKTRREAKQARQEELKVGIDKMVIVDPFYYAVDDRKGLKMEDSEDMKLNFNQQLETVAEKANIEATVLSNKMLGSDDIEEYVLISRIYDWVGERMSHDMYFIPSEQDFVQDLPEKYGTGNFSLTGILAFKGKRDNRGLLIGASIFVWPVAPLIIGYALSPRYDTYYFNLVFDISNGRMKVNEVIDMGAKPNEAFLNSIVYDHFLTISQTSESE